MKFWKLNSVDLENLSQNALVFHVFDTGKASRRARGTHGETRT